MMKSKDRQFFDSTHSYYSEGRELVSVTYVFERTFITDFSKVKWEILERARLIGDYVHDMSKAYFTGDLDETQVEYPFTGYLAAIKKFEAEHIKEVIEVEKPVYVERYGYAGTPDLVYLGKDGLVHLPDLKTPEKMHPAVQLQTAAYKKGVELDWRIKVDRRESVHVNTSGDFKMHKHTKSTDFDYFMHALAVTTWKLANNVRS